MLKFAELILTLWLEIIDRCLLIIWIPLECWWKFREMGWQHADSQPLQRKTLVIVGANFGGLAALEEVSHNPLLRVVVIDQREYFEYTPGVLRLFCDPSLFSSLSGASPRGSHEFMLGTVTEISSSSVVVSRASGCSRVVDFDYMILATGADYRQPITALAAESALSARANTWNKEAARVRNANSVLILGGGAVGAELAAEIICHFPTKRVIIVDALPHLVPLFPPQTIQHVERWFQDRRVELLLGQQLERWDENSCTLKDGRVIAADLVYVCFGLRSNSQPLSGSSFASSLGPRKEVMVNKYLQVEGHERIFAIGDVMSHPSGEIKQAYYAEMNGMAAGRNVLRHLQGLPLQRYPEDVAGSPVMPLVYVVSLGRYNGSLGFNKLVINGPIAALFKWFIEWTKVRQMRRRPIGKVVWAVGDAVSFFLSRTLVKPIAKNSD